MFAGIQEPQEVRSGAELQQRAVGGMVHETRAAGLSDPGLVRSQNEDALAVEELSDGWLLVVCDGMGGHRAGQTASRIGVEQIRERLVTSLAGGNRSDLRECLWDALVAANAAIVSNASSSPAQSGMGTTAVVLLVHRGQAYVAHAGDSRAYLLRDGVLGQLTADHTVIREMLTHGIISPEQAQGHTEAHRVTKALGLKPELAPEVRGKPIQQLPGDTFLLCSDGLTDVVADGEIAQVLSLPPKEATEALVASARGRGAPDNVTVAVYQYGKPTLSMGRRLRRLLAKPLVLGLAAAVAFSLALGLALLVGLGPGTPVVKEPGAGATQDDRERATPTGQGVPPATGPQRKQQEAGTAAPALPQPTPSSGARSPSSPRVPPATAAEQVPGGGSLPESEAADDDSRPLAANMDSDVSRDTGGTSPANPNPLVNCDHDGAASLVNPDAKAAYADAVKAMKAATDAAQDRDGGKALKNFKKARQLVEKARQVAPDDIQRAAMDEICDAEMSRLREDILALQFGIIISQKKSCKHVLGTSRDLVKYLDMQPQERPQNVVEAVERCETEGGKP